MTGDEEESLAQPVSNGSRTGEHRASYLESLRSGPPPTNEYVLNFAFFSFVAFVIIQSVFSIIANSQSMLADSEAMSIDALTYLFNLWAEQLKKGPPSKKELRHTPAVRAYKRELKRLYLELVPPAISLVALISITVITLREAISTLWGEVDGNDQEDVSIQIMLLFSGGNLLLDVMNVTCFARAHSAFGLEAVRKEHKSLQDSWRGTGETTALLQDSLNDRSVSYTIEEESEEKQGGDLINLNMCSAWTVRWNEIWLLSGLSLTLLLQHICADTLRSTAVLVAAAIATAIPSIEGSVADSSAAIAVSVIILISLIPLAHGLLWTCVKIYNLQRNPITEG